ncbi:hypothetical protein FKP32DRAFT_1592103 [Trametes sanguinea]|nr:hypothetical protein FKP32DRAFT_1592103 [Trametes sanguinea]
MPLHLRRFQRAMRFLFLLDNVCADDQPVLTTAFEHQVEHALSASSCTVPASGRSGSCSGNRRARRIYQMQGILAPTSPGVASGSHCLVCSARCVLSQCRHSCPHLAMQSVDCGLWSPRSDKNYITVRAGRI